MCAATMPGVISSPVVPGGKHAVSAVMGLCYGLSPRADAALFVMQASANTLLAHFVSIVFTNMLLRTLNKATPSPKAAY